MSETKKEVEEIRSNIEKIENVMEKYKEFINDIEEIHQKIKVLREGWEHVINCLNFDCEVHINENTYGEMKVWFKVPNMSGRGYVYIKKSDIDKVFDIVRKEILDYYISYLRHTASAMEEIGKKIESSLRDQMNKIKELCYKEVEEDY